MQEQVLIKFTIKDLSTFKLIQMIIFNNRGHLIPNTNIKSSLGELEEEFVHKFNNTKRSELYTKYLHYSTGLKKLLDNADLIQWIDGSFVTKKAEPRDIDLITFIDDGKADLLGADIEQFKYPLSLEIFGVDAYLVKVYKRESKKYPLYIGDQMYWMDKFDKTYRNRSGQKLPKGFLEIIY
jgi:hypothetical protein